MTNGTFQALDQWLLTDLRDLDYAVLPDGLAQAQKTELRGTFCVQVQTGCLTKLFILLEGLQAGPIDHL